MTYAGGVGADYNVPQHASACGGTPGARWVKRKGEVRFLWLPLARTLPQVLRHTGYRFNYPIGTDGLTAAQFADVPWVTPGWAAGSL